MNLGITSVTPIGVKPKNTDKTVQLAATRWSGCQHLRVLVDEKLAEVTCADCDEKLNPIAFLVALANQSTRWDFEHQRIVKAREELAARKVCRCKRCGEMTPIDHVGHVQARGIRKRYERSPQKEITI